VKGVEVSNTTVKQYEKLLVGGIWSIITLHYFHEEGQKGSPFLLGDLKPIQMPNMDLEELFAGRRVFTEAQWIDVLLRSTGLEPTHFDERVQWHLLCRMVPLVENNYNVCELGPRGTGKSHIYKEISPNSLLISGGHTTVANLFYNLARRTVGLVGLWDVVAFDEVAGIVFQDKDGVQIMKDYMASGSFARGKDAISAYASMVFVGNIENVEVLVKTSHLLAPFPAPMTAYRSHLLCDNLSSLPHRHGAVNGSVELRGFHGFGHIVVHTGGATRWRTCCRTDLSVCYTGTTCLYQVGASLLPRTESTIACILAFLVTMWNTVRALMNWHAPAKSAALSRSG
jgi:uncharacterized protein (TIGR02688 family)